MMHPKCIENYKMWGRLLTLVQNEMRVSVR